MSHLLHIHIRIPYTNSGQMVLHSRHTVLCEFINHISRHGPEIKSSQGVIGCVLCLFSMHGDAAAMQILIKRDAEMEVWILSPLSNQAVVHHT